MNTAEKLQAIIDACKCEVILTVRENETSYQSIEEYLSLICPDPDDADKFGIEQCIEAGIIYQLQAYPDTPIGFYCAFGPSLEGVVEQVFGALKL